MTQFRSVKVGPQSCRRTSAVRRFVGVRSRSLSSSLLAFTCSSKLRIRLYTYYIHAHKCVCKHQYGNGYTPEVIKYVTFTKSSKSFLRAGMRSFESAGDSVIEPSTLPIPDRIYSIRRTEHALILERNNSNE